MTLNEEHAEIGRMYVERENVSRRRKCIRNKILHIQKFVHDAIKEMDGEASVLNVIAARSMPHDGIPQEITALLEEERQLRTRLAELDNFFDSRGR